MKHSSARRERGAVSVEFALAAGVLFVMLLFAMETGRLMWTWAAAADATRLGARLATVCSKDASAIKERMRERLPALRNEHIVVDYRDAAGASGCVEAAPAGAANICRTVRVELSGYSHELLLPPALAVSVPIPAFKTVLPREVMDSIAHPACRT